MKIVDNPKATFILHLFGHFDNLNKTLANICLCGEELEVIVMNDKPDKMSEINKLLPKRNHYQVCSRDLHELRSYNNGIKFAHSDICILCQDDDVPPKNSNWFNDCLKVMNKDPLLGVIGLHYGSSLPWGNKNNEGHDPTIGFKYMHWLNFGPWFIRKSAAIKCGLFSYDYSGVGEDCGGADSAMCAEMWLKGYKCAMLCNKNTEEWQHHKGGRISFRDEKTKKRRKEKIAKNLEIYKLKYKDKYELIIQKIKEANENEH